jgi:hypothetical protein
LPRWVWSHDPEAYAYENYALAAESEKLGVPMEDDNRFPVNYPKGYRYERWSIDGIMEDMKAGREVRLGEGDWE